MRTAPRRAASRAQHNPPLLAGCCGPCASSGSGFVAALAACCGLCGLQRLRLRSGARSGRGFPQGTGRLARGRRGHFELAGGQRDAATNGVDQLSDGATGRFLSAAARSSRSSSISASDRRCGGGAYCPGCTACAHSRADFRAAGCVGYDIVRATDAADHFVVIESWPSKGARLAHTLETDSYEESVYSDATVEEVFRGPSRLA